MPLGKRVLKVHLTAEGLDVTLDQTLDLKVNIHKDALAIQNSCAIEITNLTQNLRQQLFSQFTAFNKRSMEQGKIKPGTPNNPYVNVSILAGYDSGQKSATSIIFEGQVIQVAPGGSPPNLSARIDCASQQINRNNWVSNRPPENATFLEYVQWAGGVMGVSSVVCETSMNDSKTWNQSATTHTAGELLVDIQDAFKPSVAAYIDNNVLYVRDLNKVVSVAGRLTIDEFIGTPMWTAYGVEFQTLFDPRLIFTSAVRLNSSMNPSLNQEFVVASLDYQLTGRDVPFYVKATAYPAAA